MHRLKGCPTHELLVEQYHDLLDRYTAELTRLGKTIGFAAAENELVQLREACTAARHALPNHEEERSRYAVAVGS